MRSAGRTLSVALALGVVLLARAAMIPAAASLGDTVASVRTDQVRLRGQLRVRSEPGYSVQEITEAMGTVVREFVSPAGVVFAVSWNGPVIPNLQQMLGSYFTQYRTAVKSERAARMRRVGHHHVDVRTPALVVHAGGHMRHYFGIAYVPALLPPNLSVSDLH
jgi:hypothetical protein